MIPSNPPPPPNQQRPRRGLWTFAPVLAVLLVAALSGAALIGGEREWGGRTKGLLGEPAPQVELAPLSAVSGGVLQPVAELGQPAIVNFFASYCTPCKVEHPLLMQMKASGLPVVGVAYRDAPEAAERFLAVQGDPYRRVLLDPEGRAFVGFGCFGMPETFVIDAQGKIVFLHRGPLDEAAAKSAEAAYRASLDAVRN